VVPQHAVTTLVRTAGLAEDCLVLPASAEEAQAAVEHNLLAVAHQLLDAKAHNFKEEQ
jgi:hypothetical protein